MATKTRNFIPALNQSWLTYFYDPMMRYLMWEEDFKQGLVYQANPQPGDHLLDIGCGTGTLTLMLQKAQPKAVVTGLDADRVILEIAYKKAVRENLEDISWDLGMADSLPYREASFDIVVSTMMIHHLTTYKKLQAFREVYRVLKPGGHFHIVDFGPPHDPLMRLVTLWMSWTEHTADHFNGCIPDYLSKAGFVQIIETGRSRRIFGPLSFYKMIRPVEEGRK